MGPLFSAMKKWGQIYTFAIEYARITLFMRNTGIFCFGALAVGVMLVLGACRRVEKTPPDAVQAHLRHGVLYAALEPDETDYFLYKGHPLGYHLELLQMFCREKGCRLVVKDGGSLREQMRMLNAGEIDLIASNLNINETRVESLLFSHPFYTSRQVLVQLKKEYLHDSLLFVDSLAQLFGKSVTVRKNSVFEERLQEINRRNHPRHIHAVGSEKTENELLNEVALGRIPAQHLDRFVAGKRRTALSLSQILRTAAPIHRAQRGGGFPQGGFHEPQTAAKPFRPLGGGRYPRGRRQHVHAEEIP